MKDIYKDKTIPQRKENNMAKNSFGGTELTTLELWSHLPKKYKTDYQWIISRLYPEDMQAIIPRIWWFHDLAKDPSGRHDFLKNKD